MPEQRKPNPIIKQIKITVASSKSNEYGDLIVTSTENNEYKISKKREHLFALFQANAEIVLCFSKYMEKEYIADAIPAQQVLSVPAPIQADKPPTASAVIAPQPVTKSLSREEHIDRSVWFKEVGELIRAKMINKESTDPYNKALYLAYFAEMNRVLGITIEKKEP